MTEWEQYLGPHPFAAVILGDVRMGKTNTACEIIDQYKGEAQPYIVAPKAVHRKYPEWMKRVDPKNVTVPTDGILYGDDLHLLFHARDWAGGQGRPLEMLARERHHYNTSLLVTSQDARVIDLNLLPMLSALIIKKPALFQTKYERSEIAPIVRKADKLIPEPSNPDDIAPKKMAYVVSNYARVEELVNDCGTVGWFNDDISKAWRGKGNMIKTQRLHAKNLNLIGKTLKTIGRTFG